MSERARVTNVVPALDRGQVATHFRCASHDATLPLGMYVTHIRAEHDGHPITITPVWLDA